MATVKLNSAGVRELLKSSGVASDLLTRAKRIAAAADSAAAAADDWGPSADAPTHEVSTFVGQNRGRATVATGNVEAMVAEAQHRTLTASIGAGR
jgi:predicted phage gp36 major capsid-like protein